MQTVCLPPIPVRLGAPEASRAGALADEIGSRLLRRFEQSRRDRKRIEMLFAHLKRVLRLGRLRLRGPRGAQFEFTLAAIAQNLRRLAKLVARPNTVMRSDRNGSRNTSPPEALPRWPQSRSISLLRVSGPGTPPQPSPSGGVFLWAAQAALPPPARKKESRGLTLRPFAIRGKVSLFRSGYRCVHGDLGGVLP